jgi:hypothetical protein
MSRNTKDKVLCYVRHNVPVVFEFVNYNQDKKESFRWKI